MLKASIIFLCGALSYLSLCSANAVVGVNADVGAIIPAIGGIGANFGLTGILGSFKNIFGGSRKTKNDIELERLIETLANLLLGIEVNDSPAICPAGQRSICYNGSPKDYPWYPLNETPHSGSCPSPSHPSSILIELVVEMRVKIDSCTSCQTFVTELRQILETLTNLCECACGTVSYQCASLPPTLPSCAVKQGHDEGKCYADNIFSQSEWFYRMHSCDGQTPPVLEQHINTAIKLLRELLTKIGISCGR